MDGLIQDLRYAVRALLKSAGYTTAAVICLTLGIGVNATMFGVVDTLLFQAPSGVREPSAVRRIYFGFGQRWFSQTSYPTYQSLTSDVPAFGSVAAFFPTDLAVGRGAGGQVAHASLASGTFFPLLGVRPLWGRLFGPADDRVGGERVAVLSSAFARQRFGTDSLAVGAPLAVGAATYTVVGVLPAGFNGVDLKPTDVWLPLAVAGPEQFAPDALTSPGDMWLQTLGRLRPGATPAEAAAQATLVRQRAVAQASRRFHLRDDSAKAYASVRPIQVARGPEAPAASKVVSRLGILSVIVLLIACANVANLLLARALGRRQEIAVRQALGAGRAHLIRHLFAESLLLAVAGGAAALMVVGWSAPLVRSVLPAGIAPGSAVNGRVFAYIGFVAVVVGLASGLVPAILSSRPDLTLDLKAGTQRGVAGRSPTRTALLLLQVALAVVLVSGAGLFVRSLWNALHLDMGFDAHGVLVATVDFHGTGYKSREARAAYGRMLDRAQRIPGVTAAALSQGGPFNWAFGMSVAVPGRGRIEAPHGTYAQWVGADYLRTMETRVPRGRGLGPGDRLGSERVAVVDESMARAVAPGESVVGQCLRLGSDTTCTEVVGVVADAKQWQLTDAPVPMVYLPLEQDSTASPTALYVRVRALTGAVAGTVQRELQATDPGGGFVQVQPLEAVIAPQYAPWRIGSAMLTLFGGLALVLSSLGLYGVLSHIVGERARELGIRVALGARPRDLLGLVLGRGLRVVAAGIAIGVLVALALGKVTASLLFDVSPYDPWVLAESACVLLLAGALASYVPARRAAQVDPMEALRAE